MSAPPIRIGTSSWSSEDWRGVFYPHGLRPVDFLAHYSTRFDTVECDATFYRIPAPRTVEGWAARTPEEFVFSSKLPREITHERGLVDCAGLVREYLGAMERLGPRLGPVVAQFAYVAKRRDAAEYEKGQDFVRRLGAFLDVWPADRELAVEVRNAKWLAPPLLELLEARGVSLALPAIYTMPRPRTLFAGLDAVTAKLAYVRFLGHHRRMDDLVARLRDEGRRTADWSEIAVDKTDEMREWVAPLRRLAIQGARVLVYFNNHYAGYGPGSAEQFRQMWQSD